MINVHVSEIERKHEQSAPVDDDQFVVVADQIIGGPCHRNTRLQKACLKLAQLLLSTAVHISNQRRNLHAIRDGCLQSFFNITAVKAKNGNLQAFLRAFYRRKERPRSIIRLNDQFHFSVSKEPDSHRQKMQPTAQGSQRVQGRDALFHYFRVSVHFLRKVASALKTVADLLVGELREQPSDPFSVAPGYVFCQIFHLCALPVV